MNLNVFLLMQKGQEGSDRHEEFFDIFPIQIGMGDYHARIIVHPIGWNLDFCLEESVALSDSQVSDPVSIATGSIVIHEQNVIRSPTVMPWRLPESGSDAVTVNVDDLVFQFGFVFLSRQWKSRHRKEYILFVRSFSSVPPTGV